jgi:anti-anti-sigma regulatory factor
MVASASVVLRAGERLSHSEACRLAELGNASCSASIIIDMSRVLEATLPALGRLVQMRRELWRHGCEMRLAAVRGQPARLMEVHRFTAVLPRIEGLPAAPVIGHVSRRLPTPFNAGNAELWSVARYQNLTNVPFSKELP